jgi:probable phosphoglycerate mutase
MSDLQCPATLLIARHGEATVQGVLSDEGDWLTDKGREQVRHLVEQVGPRRIAAVYCSTTNPAVQSAELAASALGSRLVVSDGLHGLPLLGDLDAAGPAAQDGQAVVKQFAGAIEEIADTHRGETVLMFTQGWVISLVIPRLSVNVRNDLGTQRVLPHCAPVEVEVDADGWRVISWPPPSGAVVAHSHSEQA